MIAATEFLVRVGSSTLSAGFYLWFIMFVVAMFRDPNWREVFGWSISAQWCASARILRRAAAFPFWGRLAGLMVAVGVTCLLLAGVLAVTNLFLNAPKG